MSIMDQGMNIIITIGAIGVGIFGIGLIALTLYKEYLKTMKEIKNPYGKKDEKKDIEQP